MKKVFIIFLLILAGSTLNAQMKLLVEKIGTNHKYYFMEGDMLKLKMKLTDTIIRGELADIRFNSITLSGLRSPDLMVGDIGSVYKQFAFPKKFAIYSAIFSGAIFTIIVTNHLINNEQVFTEDLFIISGAFLGASLISLSLSQKQCKIGTKWKIKVLDFSFPR